MAVFCEGKRRLEFEDGAVIITLTCDMYEHLANRHRTTLTEGVVVYFEVPQEEDQ